MDYFPHCTSWYAGGPEIVVLSPVGSNPIVDSEHVSMGKAVEADSIEKMKIYTGLEKDADDDSSVQLNWQPAVSSRDNVSVEASAVAGSFWQAVRATADIKGNKKDILKLVMNDDRIGEYDDMFDFSKLLVNINDRTNIRRMCFKPVWPTAPRDFLCCTTWQEQKDGSLLVCSRSAPDKLLEVEEGYVRGTILISGYWIQPYHTLEKDDIYYNDDVNALGCKVTLTAHTDLGGTMPAWIINMLSAEAPLKILIKIRSIFEAVNAVSLEQ